MSRMRRWQFCFQVISLEINFDETCFSPDGSSRIDANVLNRNKTDNEKSGEGKEGILWLPQNKRFPRNVSFATLLSSEHTQKTEPFR